MNYVKTTASELLGPLNEVEVKNAPRELYVAGDTTLLRNCAKVAIVGSRDASPEGIRRAKKLAKILVERSIVVVSGLAKGIDTAAHTSALDNGGRTVAVIGTPLEKVYPKENTQLQHRLMKDQLVLSQFASGYPTKPQNFPMRNRVMALVSDATVIIEAGETSGSISQGWEALRLGRALFIAESVVQTKSWPATMIPYGARVLSDATIDELFDLLPEPASEDVARAFAI